jgi:transposase-like protein
MGLHCPHCGAAKIWQAGLSRPVEAFYGRSRQRFRCAACLKRFAENFYLMSYRLKHPDPALNSKIYRLCIEGLSNRRIARFLYISPHCVRLRLWRLSRQAFSFQGDFLKKLKINEPICFDGMENFAGSQYDVNNLQQALGRDSLFIYDFNLATMNRKGRMSNWQKKRLKEIEQDFGRYNPSAIRLATTDLLLRLEKKWGEPTPFVLLSDEHFQYRRVVKEDLRHLKIEHVTISSKACRNFQNILFPVNHVDLNIRQHVRAFSRETISFSKTHAAMCQKYMLYVVHKNYMIPQFTKIHVRRPEAHLKSPAELLGLTDRMLHFEDIFYKRARTPDFSHLNSDWQHFVHDRIPEAYHRHPKFVRKAA